MRAVCGGRTVATARAAIRDSLSKGGSGSVAFIDMVNSKSNALARVYLAGPDVFYPEPLKVAAYKKKVLAGMELEGVFPLDSKLEACGLSPERFALRIAEANEAMIRSCDIVIANMEPWQGPGMDVGTAYEMGFGRALGKVVIGYTPDRRRFCERVRQFLEAQPAWARGDGFQIEDFGQMADNLMLVNAVSKTDGEVEIPPSFEEAALLAKRLWLEKIRE